MARGRFVSGKITDSVRLNALPIGCVLLFTWMITKLDCEGRLPGEARLVNKKVMPLLHFSDKRIEEWLNMLWDAKKNGLGLIERYEVDGHKYIWMPGFEGEQKGLRKDREAPSEIPAPPEESIKLAEPSQAKRSVVEEIIDPTLAKMAAYYVEHLGQIASGSDVEKLKDIAKTYPEGWFEKAIDESVVHGGRTLRYVEKILERWKAEEVNPLDNEREQQLHPHRGATPQSLKASVEKPLR